MPKESGQSIPFNELAIRKVAKAKHEKQTAYVIKGVPGLNLTVYPTGKATFSVRFSVGRKRRKEVLGAFGVLSLDDAKAEALRVAAGAARDEDVRAKAEKDASRPTLRMLFASRMEKDEGTAQRTLEDYKAALEREVFPFLGDRIAEEITAEEFAKVLKRIEDRSKHAAHKCRSGLGSTYRWAQRRSEVWVNPLAGLAFTHQSERRKRIASDDELARVWRAVDLAERMGVVTPGACNIVRLAILTGQRNSEVAGMEVAELKNLDSATPRWDIPARRMKRKEDDQHVPLSKQAVAVIREALRHANSTHVFPGTTHGRREGVWLQEHVGQETVSRAMARITKIADVEDLHLHDMRKCITSWLAEHGHATPEVLDAILHHGRKGVTGTHYNFALYEKQVRQALQVWGDHIEALGMNSSARSNVVELASAAR